MRRLAAVTLIALPVLSPTGAAASPDPGLASHFAPAFAPAEAATPRAPGARGELRVVRAPSRGVGGLRVAVLVEGRLAVDPLSFAQSVGRALADRRGWRQAGYAFRLVRNGPADVEIVLASPQLTDRLCAPLQTLGRYSCAQGNRAVLNFERWRLGIPEYPSLALYRTYMINHEVGHLLGRGHSYCPGPGAFAPLMMQQTKGIAPCRPNPWPLSWE